MSPKNKMEILTEISTEALRAPARITADEFLGRHPVLVPGQGIPFVSGFATFASRKYWY